MANYDACNRINACGRHEQVDDEQNPGQILGLEFGAEPEIHNDVLVQFAPDVEHGQNHGIHQKHEIGEEADDDARDPVEEQQVEVVARTLLELVSFQAIRILVQEVAIQHEMESGLWVYRVVKHRR